MYQVTFPPRDLQTAIIDGHFSIASLMSIILLVVFGTQYLHIAIPPRQSTLIHLSLKYCHTNVTWRYAELPDLTWKTL